MATDSWFGGWTHKSSHTIQGLSPELPEMEVWKEMQFLPDNEDK